MFRYTITLIQDSKQCMIFSIKGQGAACLLGARLTSFKIYTAADQFYLSEVVTHCMFHNAVLTERTFKQLF